jgi:hypothetical protein
MKFFFPASAIFVALVNIWSSTSLLVSIQHDAPTAGTRIKQPSKTTSETSKRENSTTYESTDQKQYQINDQQNAIVTHQNTNDTSSPFHHLFHFIFTTSPETINWRFIKAIEAVFFHHPKSKVIIHSQTIPSHGTILDKFQQANYHLSVQNYSFEELLNDRLMSFLNDTVKQSFLKKLPDNQKNKYWYSHATDILRLLILEQNGGIYLDTDVHLISPIQDGFKNVLGFQGRGNDKVNGAVMIFDVHNRFIQSCLKDALLIASKRYDKRLWEIFGPQLLTRHWNEWKNELLLSSRGESGGGGNNDGNYVVEAVPMHVFYPYGIYKVRQCFTTPKEEFNPIQPGSTIAVHLNTGITREYNYTLAGTVCDELFKNNCIFCDFQHTVNKGHV